MNEFSIEDLRTVQAAQGWLELGNHLEANEELENISPRLRSHPDVLEMRWQIFEKEKRWEACVDIALAIMRAEPNREFGWTHHSFALHELGRTQEAYDHLASVAQKFPGIQTIPYNLSCYCAQLGRIEESMQWFKKALLIDENQTRLDGIDDPDLKPLWDSMSGTMWTKE